MKEAKLAQTRTVRITVEQYAALESLAKIASANVSKLVQRAVGNFINDEAPIIWSAFQKPRSAKN